MPSFCLVWLFVTIIVHVVDFISCRFSACCKFHSEGPKRQRWISPWCLLMSFDVFSFCFHSVFVEFRRRSLAQPSLCLLVSQSRGQLFSNIVRVQVALVTTKIRYLHSKSLLEHLPGWTYRTRHCRKLCSLPGIAQHDWAF